MSENDLQNFDDENILHQINASSHNFRQDGDPYETIYKYIKTLIPIGKNNLEIIIDEYRNIILMIFTFQ